MSALAGTDGGIVTRVNVNEARGQIARLQGFETRSGTRAHTGLWAESEVVRSKWPGTGQLPEEWVKVFRDASGKGELDYVVYSYYTPIAWVTTDRKVVVPPVEYSRTTSGHQSTAISGLQGFFGLEEYRANLVTAVGV